MGGGGQGGMMQSSGSEYAQNEYFTTKKMNRSTHFFCTLINVNTNNFHNCSPQVNRSFVDKSKSPLKWSDFRIESVKENYELVLDFRVVTSLCLKWVSNEGTLRKM